MTGLAATGGGLSTSSCYGFGFDPSTSVLSSLPTFNVLVLSLIGTMALSMLLALACTCRRRGPSPPAQHRAHRFFVAISTLLQVGVAIWGIGMPSDISNQTYRIAWAVFQALIDSLNGVVLLLFFFGFEPDSIDYEPKRRLKQSGLVSCMLWLLLPLLYTLGVQLSCKSHMYVPDEAFVYGHVDTHDELETALESCESDIYWLIRCAYHFVVLLILLATHRRFGSPAARATYHLLSWVIGFVTVIRAIVALLLYERQQYSLCIMAAATICSKCCDFFILAALLYNDARKSTHGMLIGSLNTPLMGDANNATVSSLASHSGVVPGSRVIVEARHVINRHPIQTRGAAAAEDSSTPLAMARMLWSAELRSSSHDDSPREVVLRLLPRLRSKRDFHSEAREFTNLLQALPAQPNLRPGHSMFWESSSNSGWLVMDPSRGDTLEQRLLEPGLPFRASATRVLQVLTGVLAGLRHLHQQGWVLRDLTPRNILIERVAAQWNAPSTEMPYIIDFGLARRLPSPSRGWVDPADAKVLLNGPLMPPEVVTDGTFLQASDMWMFGLLVRSIYMNGEQPTHALPFFDLPASCPTPLASLISPCFATMASGRPTAHELYQLCSTLAAGLPPSTSGVMVSSGSSAAVIDVPSSTSSTAISPRATATATASPRAQLLQSPKAASSSSSNGGGMGV